MDALPKRFDDEVYQAFCAAHPDLRVERDSDHRIVMLPPVGGESSYRSIVVGAQLGLRPLERVPSIPEFAAGCFAVERPVDLGSLAVHCAVPGARFPAQSFEVGESPLPQALP